MSIVNPLHSAWHRQMIQNGAWYVKKLSPSEAYWFRPVFSRSYDATHYIRRRVEKRAKERFETKGESSKETHERRRNPHRGSGDPPSEIDREREIEGANVAVTDHAQANWEEINKSPVAALCNPPQVMSPESKTKKADGLNGMAAAEEKFRELSDRLGYLIRDTKDERSSKALWSEVKKLKILNMYELRAAHDHSTWTIAVNCMKSARELKERLIREKPLPESELNRLDRYDDKACQELFGAFCYLLSDKQEGGCQPIRFDKDEVDRLMELCFGSLDDPDRDLSCFNEPKHDHDAKILFSKYLARKVWCPAPWAKIQDAESKFYKRVCDNKITTPVNVEALEISRRILDLITQDLECDDIRGLFDTCADHEHTLTIRSPREFQERQYVPDGACVELSRSEGGKRHASLFGVAGSTDPRVVACPILTGGKIRVVTIDSMHNQEFIWINKFLGSCFRKLKCSVFGGKVEEWYDRIGGLKPQEGEYLISGDLESATDNFDGRITEVLIDDFCKRFYPKDTWREKSRKMKSFTTRAQFRLKNGSRKQTRGQLMGSVVSFPFLCILSLTAYMFALKKQNRKLFDTIMGPDDQKAWKALMRLKSVGINGDDVAFAGNQEAYLAWMDGVTAIGGIVSKGKSLRNRRYFTINSELWSVDGKINCLRPSLVTALTGDNKYFINPAVEWKEFRLCNLAGIKRDVLYGSHAERIWNLTEKLNLHLPRSLGGLALVDGRKFLSPEELKEELFEAWTRMEADKRTRSVMVGTDEALCQLEELRTLTKDAGKTAECWVHRDKKNALSLRYRSSLGSWRISPQEASQILLRLRDPRLTRTSDRVLELCKKLLPAIEKMRRVTAGEVRSEYDQLCSQEHEEDRTRKDLLVDQLYSDYARMLKGWQRRVIPLAWKNAYGAEEARSV